MRALHSLSRFIFYFVSHALSPLSCPFPVVSLQRCGASLPTCTPWPSGGVLSPNFDWAVCWLAGSGCTTGIGMFQVCVTHPHAAPSIACLSFDRVCVLLPSLLCFIAGAERHVLYPTGCEGAPRLPTVYHRRIERGTRLYVRVPASTTAAATGGHWR